MVTMKSYSTLKNKSQITSIAIGGFDGMHKAHQELFKNLDANGAILVIDSGYANMTPKLNRQEYSSYPIFYYPLKSIKHLSGSEFIRLLNKDFPRVEKIVVGYDFCFGANRECYTIHLQELFDKEVKIVEEFSINNISVHSRVIREYLKKGDIKTSNLLLGKDYKIKGDYIKGQGLGTKNFVPTINLKVDDYLLPKDGVYVTRTIINAAEYNSITFLGHRSTIDNSYAIETHILDQDIKDGINTVEIIFIDRLRDNKKFDNFKNIKIQILSDIENAKATFVSLVKDT